MKKREADSFQQRHIMPGRRVTETLSREDQLDAAGIPEVVIKGLTLGGLMESHCDDVSFWNVVGAHMSRWDRHGQAYARDVHARVNASGAARRRQGGIIHRAGPSVPFAATVGESI